MSKKLKIAVWVLSDYKSSIGGGFSLYEKIIQLIDEFKFSDEVEICFVGHRPKARYNFKKEYICVYPLPLGFLRGIVTKISHKLSFIGRMEGSILKRNDIGLIYYPIQGYKKIKNFPFISANWDIGHKSNFAFPEIAMNNKFELRDKWYSREIHKALMVFAESEEGKIELTRYTALNPDRIGIVPLFPGGVVDLNAPEVDQKKFLDKNNLLPGKYFFYPAQFWAHKNHYNLLMAFSKIIKEFPEIKLVLTGSDKGNKKYIVELVSEMNLEDKILFTGFVSNEDIFALYKNACSLVMPSFTGATNMPLLEARMLDCPVLCSDLKGHREIMNDGALYFSPADSNAMADAMRRILNKDFRSEILLKAKVSIGNTKFTSANAMKALDENLTKLLPIRLCWGKNDKIF